MSHIYINTEPSDDILDVLSFNKKIIDLHVGESTNIKIFYDHKEWQDEPFMHDDKSSLYIAGWFLFKGRKNDISGFKSFLDDNIESCIKEKNYSVLNSKVNAGVFTAIYFYENRVYIISDPFSLSSHYYSLDYPVRLSPYPSLIGGNDYNDIFDKILNLQGHLFGKYTAFNDVFRIIPGDVIEISNEKLLVHEHKFLLEDDIVVPQDIPKEIEKLTSCWEKENLSLALSAGFDSRLIATTCKPHLTYTWGPKSSLDRRVGAKLAKNLCSKHMEFLFKANRASILEENICEQLFSGCVKAYNPQFLANYKYVNSKSSINHVALDGYLGDVLQRGVYLYPSSYKGEFLKLFPNALDKQTSTKEILRTRYKNLDESLFLILYEDFLLKTNHLHNIEPNNKVTFYEFIYGRGLRYITTGALVMNSLFKTVVPCFAHRVIFSSLIRNETKQIANYTIFNKIWSNVEAPYCDYISEGFYSPKTNVNIIPILNLFGRICTNKIPILYNYTREK
ncbi:hypothetical protein BK412_15970 [Vibrio campbellii]|uniref:hypothetical protein n=1 Tax=Vibrio campbellii TaxID=680 RepID=UPI0009BFB9AA|nr:hypothetical protein [Vibrio campbellii]OQQ01858.1 hypothetical protein BK412_15970 [Vibrio campbellii]